MNNTNKKFKKVAVLDSVIFYPEHRVLLNSIAEEVVEYPSSLPANLKKQYDENPELFLNKKCYTQIATDNIPLQLLMNRVEGADVIISCWTNIPDEILRLNPQLKLIIFWTHEKEHRINMRLANELGIVVENVPDYGTDAVAEVVFAGMWQLIHRNFASNNSVMNEGQTMHAVIDYVFSHFRKLQVNEKNTRSGKFTHHFHKIGEAKFDFTQKNIDELIPERLIAYQRVGLLNMSNTESTLNALQALGVLVEEYQIISSSLATYYKFLCENDLVFYDSTRINPLELAKLITMFPSKLIDIRSLTSADYIFTNKTFSIVGLGRIGRSVARIAKHLGFHVSYYSRTRDLHFEDELDIEFAEMPSIMESADIISVHLPAHKAENLITAELISKMRRGSIFINTADGNTLDQHALTQRMVAREVFAYLDVYPGLPRKDILGLPMSDKTDWKIHKELSNNVIAYRAGWKTQESIKVKTYKLLGEMIPLLSEIK